MRDDLRADATRGTTLVALGQITARLAGLVRERVLAQYLGTGAGADIFTAATRIPGLLQQVLGDSLVLSAFVPAYARVRGRDDAAAAPRLARTALVWLVQLALVAVAGIAITAPILVTAMGAGMPPDMQERTTRLVRVLAGASGMIVVSGWAAGVLTVHRRYLLAQMAPVLSAGGVVVALVRAGRQQSPLALAETAAWGALAGAALQLAFLMWRAMALAGPLGGGGPHRTADAAGLARTAGPAAAHGALVRLAGWSDTALATLLPTGALATLAYGQLIAGIPISLVAVSTSTALVGQLAVEFERHDVAVARQRVRDGLMRVAFFTVPAAAAFVALGDVVAATIYQGGRFSAGDATAVWWVLAASAVGLLATAERSVYATVFHARADTVTPLRLAAWRWAARLVLSIGLGFVVPRALGLDQGWALAGITVAGGLTAWAELLFVRRALRPHIGNAGTGGTHGATLWTAAIAAAGVATLLKPAVAQWSPVVGGLVILGTYAAIYVAVTAAFGITTLLPRRRARQRL